MNTKKLSRRIGIMIPVLTLLSGCSFFDVKFTPFIPSGVVLEQPAVTADHYYRPADYAEDYLDVVKSHPNPSQRLVPLDSIGTQKVLVIPVEFPDYRAERLDGDAAVSRTIIQNAFFGASQTTQWESVAGFYYASSYGQLTLDGFVSDWYLSPETVADLINTGSKTVATERILKAAVNWYKDTYDDILSYDQDHDGALDAVFLVYSAPYVDKDSLFWAFTSFDTGVNYETATASPLANAYVWASYHFLNVYHQNGDSHTFIHEFGHLLGLTDYYNTSSLPAILPQANVGDSTYKRYQYTHGPTGKVDMMDYSIGDHTALSKMLLNWTKPYVVTTAGEITIHPFNSSGEVIIIAPDWNGRAFDEYIAIEMYAPSGLNYVDSEQAYGHSQARLMGNYGIKVYHVDARASYHRTSGDGFLGYENDVEVADLPPEVLAGPAYYRKVAHTNTYGTTINENLIYRLLEKGDEGNFLLGKMADNDTMYYQGESFGVTDYADFEFDSGATLPLRFTVSALSRYDATLTFFA